MIFFHTNLTAKRLDHGWTQEQAAEKLTEACGREISTGRYQAWERKRSEPEYELLIFITEVFGIDDLYLFICKDLYKNFFQTNNNEQ